MTTEERIEQILADWPPPSDAETEAAARVWASIQPAEQAA